MPFEFHENMVVWKRSEKTERSWKGFGFFGESKHGKTPLSFAFAHALFVNEKPELKILDDCFTVENGRARQCRVWGNRDRLAQEYYAQLSEAMKRSGRSVNQIGPENASYHLSHVVAYLLLIADGAAPYRKERCHRQIFVEKLMSTNPFAWNYPKPGKEVVLQRFQENWNYYIIYRQRETTKELIDLLTNQALTDRLSLG